jgi:predicted RNA-binding protein YlqC (UPF0109 family)
MPLSEFLKMFFSMLTVNIDDLTFEISEYSGFLYVKIESPHELDVGRMIGKEARKKQEIKGVLGLALKVHGYIKSNNDLELRINRRVA